MAKIHGKNTVVTVDGTDLSTFTTTSNLNRTQSTTDTTTYGTDSREYCPGLWDATFSLEGFYDSDSPTGPRAVFDAIQAGGVEVPIIRQPEGTGSGLAQDSFNALLTSYVETNPVAEIITWSAEFQVSGDVDTTAQA